MHTELVPTHTPHTPLQSTAQLPAGGLVWREIQGVKNQDPEKGRERTKEKRGRIGEKRW